jgi:hypothetical protein
VVLPCRPVGFPEFLLSGSSNAVPGGSEWFLRDGKVLGLGLRILSVPKRASNVRGVWIDWCREKTMCGSRGCLTSVCVICLFWWVVCGGIVCIVRKTGSFFQGLLCEVLGEKNG